MRKNVLVLRSSISSTLLKKTLFRGFKIAFLGIVILIFTGSYLPVEFLRQWGWILFILSLGLITLGLLPYRHLSRLQIEPNELILVDSDHIVFSQRGKNLFTIPIQAIAQTKYVTQSHFYGIALWLKPNLSEPVRVHQLSKEVKNMRRLGQQLENADLFFLYFNQHAYNELKDWQSEE